MGDGKQSDACILGRLEDLAFHVNAYSAGAFIQEGILWPGEWGQSERGCGPSIAVDLVWPQPPTPWGPIPAGAS